MNPLNQINIEEQKTIYDIAYTYHSDKMCQNYDLSITGVEENDGKVSFYPTKTFFQEDGFKFIHSDPDRVIAIAEMMKAFAQAIKKENQKTIDTNANA